MRNFFIYISVFFFMFTACNPFLSPIERKEKRAERKLEKLVAKYPQLLKTDTIFDSIPVKIPEVNIDNNIPLNQDYSDITKKLDSLLLSIGISEPNTTTNTIISYIKERPILPNDTLVSEINGFTIKTFMKPNGELGQNIYKPETEQKTEVPIIVNKVEVKEKTWLEKIISVLNKISGLLILLFIIFVAIKTILKKYLKL